MLKRIVTIAAISALAAFTLSACGGYSNIQTDQQRQAMPFCGGLHLKSASWNYVDQFGNNIFVNGSCNKGMKHGNFTYMMDGKLIATVKYSRDSEHKTSCQATGKKYRSTLDACLVDAANAKAAAMQQPQQQPQQQYILVPANQAAEQQGEVPAEVQQ